MGTCAAYNKSNIYPQTKKSAIGYKVGYLYCAIADFLCVRVLKGSRKLAGVAACTGGHGWPERKYKVVGRSWPEPGTLTGKAESPLLNYKDNLRKEGAFT